MVREFVPAAPLATAGNKLAKVISRLADKTLNFVWVSLDLGGQSESVAKIWQSARMGDL